MLLDTIRIAILILITLVYALFDIFNKRNVPDAFAYGSLIIAILVTLTYPFDTILYSFAIAIVIGLALYLLYKGGHIGGGDVFELVAISLLLPMQPTPIVGSLGPALPYSFPFILSVFVAAGIVSLVFVPIYYLIFAKNSSVKSAPREKSNARPNLIKAIAILACYLILYFIIVEFFGASVYSTALILVMGVCSATIIMYNEKINARMLSFKGPGQLEEGDMIGFGSMDEKYIASLSKKYKHFGKLVTKEMIREMKGSKTKLPVYDNSLPLALPLFLGVLISLLVGNILLLLL